MPTDFQAMTDAEINRWAAERDGIEDPHWWCERCEAVKGDCQVTYQERCTSCGNSVVWKDFPDYAASTLLEYRYANLKNNLTYVTQTSP